ncbi:N-terminal domain of NEFA-interacting nuclear protein NIP30-domain-containing protein [Mycena floridula]|nr:N-terminal domain of NEFA-interacting nuclear protein NIP30-domain-containing protein [Mycena floridula]
MEEAVSISMGDVGSRFVSQDDVESARAKRDEQWKAAYARLGQEPPKPVEDSTYDGRSLAEKLAANKIAKQEEWEEKSKLANQFRALEQDEIMFLDGLRERQEAEEKQRKEEDGEEVKNFKEAIAARLQASNPPARVVDRPAPAKPALAKKEAKKGLNLKGVVVKKKVAKPAPSSSKKVEEPKSAEKDEQPASKRQRVD